MRPILPGNSRARRYLSGGRVTAAGGAVGVREGGRVHTDRCTLNAVGLRRLRISSVIAAPRPAASIAPVDLSLSEAQQQLRAAARETADREVVTHATEWDRAEAVDRGIVAKLGEVGFLGLGLPEEYAGTEGDLLSYVLMMEELGRGDTSIRGIVSVSLGLVAKSINAWGSAEQKERFLPDLATGRTLGCFGLTEPGTGSDAASLTARAVREGDDWVISGNKMFITNGTWADIALVFARSGGPGPKGISAFLVPTDAAGFERREIKGKLGLRGQATAELILDGVHVPDANRLGDEGAG